MKGFEEVTKYHTEWINIMKGFGAKDKAEDIVQDVYIRILEGADKEKLFCDGKLNKAYVYFALRNTWINHVRKQRSNRDNKNRIELVHFPKLYGSQYSDYGYNIFSSKWGYSECVAAFNEDNPLSFDKLDKYEIILKKINEEIDSWHWYDSMLFSFYVSSGKSIRTLAKETKISRDSIFQTLKNCKTRIKNAIGEDWEDFRNKDYHLIKAE